MRMINCSDSAGDNDDDDDDDDDGDDDEALRGDVKAMMKQWRSDYDDYQYYDDYDYGMMIMIMV